MRNLKTVEVNGVAGGVDWGKVGAACAIVALGVAIVATDGLAGLAVGVITGAGTAGEIGTAATGVALAGAGGAVGGNGLSH